VIPPWTAHTSYGACPWCGTFDTRAHRPVDPGPGRRVKRLLLAALTPGVHPVTDCCARPVTSAVEVIGAHVHVTFHKPTEESPL
jgi:hypothetical protein